MVVKKRKAATHVEAEGMLAFVQEVPMLLDCGGPLLVFMSCGVQVVHSGPSSGSCIFHSNIWIPTRQALKVVQLCTLARQFQRAVTHTRSLEDERDCFVREGQA